MTYEEATSNAKNGLLTIISERFSLNGYRYIQIGEHEGGRNLIFSCEKEGFESYIIRIVFLPDRTFNDLLGEAEYIDYLQNQGATVAKIYPSVAGDLVEKLVFHDHIFYASMFERAPGMLIADNGYQYRDKAPISEYFYNCGKLIGKLHRLAKDYMPEHKRQSLFDHYTTEHVNDLLPDSIREVKKKIIEILDILKRKERTRDTFGMLHFDIGDGNYHVDMSDGTITLFDFDNCCYGPFMYEIADLWAHGTGWIMFEPDADKRRAFMDEYFHHVMEGYASENTLPNNLETELPLYMKLTIIESIMDEFEVRQNAGADMEEEDEGLNYLYKCLLEDIPYRGYFDDIYSVEAPFELSK